MELSDEVLGDLTLWLRAWARPITYRIFGVDQSMRLLVYAGEGKDILDCQKEAFKNFMASGPKLTRAIEERILEHYLSEAPELRERTGPEFSASNIPEIRDPSELNQLLNPLDLSILYPLSQNRDKDRIVGISFDCSWAPDLGLAVRIENEAIVQIGPHEIIL